jgi:tryptophanase
LSARDLGSGPDDDFARKCYERVLAEPFRVKVAEKISLPNRAERRRVLEEAFYSPAFVDSKDVFVDLVTDSGTSAMSDEQWAGMMRGDEAYVRSRNYAHFERAVQETTGFEHVVPTHQGRAAENILMELMAGPGKVVLGNTHFDTTRAHIEHRGALPLDLVGDALWRFEDPEPFKGNFDLAKLERAFERHGANVALVVITVLNNLACSSPVSMENIRGVKALADRFGVPVFFDACRFAENAYFIKTREPGYADLSVTDIALEMLGHGAGCWMSAKKDALVNVGGFIAVRDEGLARRCQELLVLYEGFYTYGGLARRDLEAVAIGLKEGLDEEYLTHRTGLVRYLGELMQQRGVPISTPVGGSGVFANVEALYPHLAPEKLPGIALFADLYLEGALRAAAIPFTLNTVAASSGETVKRVFQFARFAIPRRVYGKAHMEYVAEIMGRVRELAPNSRGFRVVHAPPVLGHFFAKYAPLTP